MNFFSFVKTKLVYGVTNELFVEISLILKISLFCYKIKN